MANERSKKIPIVRFHGYQMFLTNTPHAHQPTQQGRSNNSSAEVEGRTARLGQTH